MGIKPCGSWTYVHLRANVALGAMSAIGAAWGKPAASLERGPQVPDRHTRAVSEGRLTLRDGRALAWREYGPNDGRPNLRFQGPPGSRYSRHPHEASYDRHQVRVILFDRPGYGASSRLPERGISAVADDASELLDHLGLDVVHVG